MNHPIEVTVKGMAGTIAPLLGVITSMQEQFLWWARMLALLAGIVVSILTAVSLYRTLRASQEALQARAEEDVIDAEE